MKYSGQIEEVQIYCRNSDGHDHKGKSHFEKLEKRQPVSVILEHTYRDYVGRRGDDR